MERRGGRGRNEGLGEEEVALVGVAWKRNMASSTMQGGGAELGRRVALLGEGAGVAVCRLLLSCGRRQECAEGHQREHMSL